jgi:4-amino-4-deoxy-L-arabinose transferase-like glycosyltransferase
VVLKKLSLSFGFRNKVISVPKKITLVYFCLLVFLVIAVRLVSLNLILDTDSSANAFFARHMQQGETLYDKFHPAHHLPGIYYTFLLAFNLFGDNPFAPRVLLFIFIFISAWLIFLMGREFFDERAGILGAFFYILISSMATLSGTSAEMEHFANLPLIATMFLFLTLLRNKSPARQFFWVGVLGAICILYKIIFVGSLITAGIVVLAGVWLERDQAGNWKKIFSQLSLMAVGFSLPLALVGGYFASLGLWQRLMLVFTLGFTYFNNTGLLPGNIVFPKPFGFPLFMVAMNNVALLIFGLMGAYRLTRRAFPVRTTGKLIDLTLVLWLVISFALAGSRGGGYAHYVLVVEPPLALIAGIEISLTYQRWRVRTSPKYARLGAGLMVTLIVMLYCWGNYDLYRPYLPAWLVPATGEKTSYQSYQDRQQAIIDYIKSHTTPDDFIYVWSVHLQEYYYADRLPPIDILWPEYVSATGPPKRIFNPRTKYIVVDDVKERPQWLLDGLAQNYSLETTLDGIEIYGRVKK